MRFLSRFRNTGSKSIVLLGSRLRNTGSKSIGLLLLEFAILAVSLTLTSYKYLGFPRRLRSHPPTTVWTRRAGKRALLREFDSWASHYNLNYYDPVRKLTSLDALNRHRSMGISRFWSHPRTPRKFGNARVSWLFPNFRGVRGWV